MAIITEERFFSPTGQLIKWTTAPLVTHLRTYRRLLGSRLAGVSRHRDEGKRGLCFHLMDGCMLIVILGRKVEAMASPMTPTVQQTNDVAD